jgi:3-dehydroquinate synthase class II
VGIHKKEDSIIVIRKKGKQIKSVASKVVLQNCLYRHIKKGDSTSTFRKILQETMVVRIRRKAGNAISAGKLKRYHQKDLLLFKNLIPLIYLKSKQVEIINKQLRA